MTGSGARAATEPEVRALARRVRTSSHLSGSLKRYWLSALPHLTPEHREHLDAILRGDAPPEGADADDAGRGALGASQGVQGASEGCP